MKEQFIEIYNELITRPGADKLLEWLEKSDFFSAPASSKYHLNVAGGLCEHSINVYNRIKRLCVSEAFENPNFQMPEPETIAVVGLLHDLCKIGYYKLDSKNQKTYDADKVSAAPKYQVKHDNAGDFIWETVPFYIVDEQLVYGHGEKSVYIASGFMRLTRDEATAIRWHMGPWNDGEKQYASAAFAKYPLALLTHIADMQATYIDEADTKQ